MRKRGGLRASRQLGLRRTFRGLLPDGNPLRRTADRLEFGVMAALIVAFLVGAPLAAMAIGHWAYAGASGAERAQNAAWRPVTAVVTKGTQKNAAQAYGDSEFAQVPAAWTAPDGAARTGKITVTAGTGKGTRVRIWTDESGSQTGPPLQQPQVADQAALAGVLSVFGLGAVLGLAAAVLHRGIDRRRLAGWDAAWDTAGPLWSNYR